MSAVLRSAANYQTKNRPTALVISTATAGGGKNEQKMNKKKIICTHYRRSATHSQHPPFTYEFNDIKFGVIIIIYCWCWLRLSLSSLWSFFIFIRSFFSFSTSYLSFGVSTRDPYTNYFIILGHRFCADTCVRAVSFYFFPLSLLLSIFLFIIVCTLRCCLRSCPCPSSFGLPHAIA